MMHSAELTVSWLNLPLLRSKVFLWVSSAVICTAALLGFLMSVAQNPVFAAHFLYIPIFFAASFYALPGGLLAAVTAACLFWLSVSLGPSEEFGPTHILRTAIYLLFGGVVGGIFQIVKNQLAQAKLHTDRVSQVYGKVLSSLANTVEVRDRHTLGHCERVATNALVLGKAVGLDKQQLELLHWSALLHDLGKLMIPDYILLKDGPLTELEYAEVQHHPDHGAELLSSISHEFSQIAEIVKSHHECWDGSGYPRALSGESIPLLARIISIVDVFEALTSRRPYRQPMSVMQAVHYIQGAAGSKFDPKLVEVFLGCFERGELRASPEALLMASFEPVSSLATREVALS
jgi:putative nucleotidyltransferase with HDIG domain